MYFTMKDFKEKQIVVSFKNKMEQERFLKECEKEGLEWLSGDKATDFTFPVNECVIYGDDSGKYLTRGRKERFEN